LDASGNVSEEIGFYGKRRRYERDDAGRVVKVWWPSGRITENRYDANGRVVETKAPDGCFTRFTRDKRGLIVAAENESGRVEIAHDHAGRVIVERVSDREVRSRYGYGDERVEMETSLGARVGMVRDPMGKVHEMVLGQAGRVPDVRWEHDALSVERVLRYDNGIQVAWKTDGL